MRHDNAFAGLLSGPAGHHTTTYRASRCAAVARRVLVAAFAIAARPALSAAQQAQLDVHGNFAVGTATHARSWGGGAGVQFTFGGKSAPVKVSASPGFDYLKQEGGSSGQPSISLDVNVQPGGSSSVTPYAGASVSNNWVSGASNRRESKVGYDTMAGAQFKLGMSGTSAKLEERFGYVKGEEHTLTTRAGFLVSF